MNNNLRPESTAAQIRKRQPTGSSSRTSEFLKSQAVERNFLQPTGFRFQVSRIPNASYFGNSVNIPSLTLGTTVQPNYLRPLPTPGDIIDFEDLTFGFLVDQNLQNYMEIQNWIRGLGFPESLDEIYDLQSDTEGVPRPDLQSGMNIYSDGTLIVYDSQNNPNFKIKFKNLFPYSLSTIQFDATVTDLQYFTAEVSFKYSIYKITSLD